jgi:hypothetical protein
VKRLPVLTLLAAIAAQSACASKPARPATRPEARPTTSTGAIATAPRGSRAGADSPRAAVEDFLKAVRAQDLQAMSTVWGTQKGPARDQMDRNYLEKAELIMQCFFAHDRYRIVNDLPGAESGKRTFRVELSNSGRTRETNFYVVQGRGSRWYVENADMDPVKEFCTNRPS